MSVHHHRPALWRALLLAVALMAGLFSATAPAGAATRTTSSIAVTFDVDATTAFGDTVLVSGDASQLGTWNAQAAVPLSTTSATYPLWTTTVYLPAGSTVQYKYLIRSANGTVTWETVPNRTLTVSTTGTTTTFDRWNVGTGTAVDATFHVTATTSYGQNLYVVGNLNELGGWDPTKAVQLTTDSAAYPQWSGSLMLPPNTAIQYKYLKKNPDGTVTWEGGGNRSTVTPPTGTLTLNDTWQ